jgi:hypothetical protein
MSRIKAILALAGLAVALSGCYYDGGPGYRGPYYYHHPHYYWGH